MVDQVSRSAARVAALVAVPVALLTGLGVFALLNDAAPDRAAPPAATTPAGPAATGPVPTELRELPEPAETACRLLLAALPADLDGLGRRPVTAGPAQNAAYGDPAVVLTCGVPAAGYAPTDEVYRLPAGERGVVCWYAAQTAVATVWTTLDRAVPVAVRVPAGYDGPGQLVTQLSAPIAETVEPGDSAPWGCTG